MDFSDIVRQRLQLQRLAGQPFATPEDMIRWNGAVQAQDYAGAKWGIAQRCSGIDDAELDRRFDEGAILRTHIMRPTWHFVLPEDLRWMMELTAPRVHVANGSRYRQLGLDDAQFTRSHALLVASLSGGKHLTRAEIRDVLQAGGIDTTGQRLAYILMHGELERVVCSGPRRGKQFTYALFDERVPPASAREREDALVELTRRYFTSHGPASSHDFAWWSGLTVSEARTGIDLLGDDITSEVIDDTTWWVVPSNASAGVQQPRILLLPNFDELYVAYRDHAPSIDPSLRERLTPQSDALAAHLVVRNGFVVGAWRRKQQGSAIHITTDVLVELDDDEQRALRAAAKEYSEFLAQPVVIDEILAH